VGNGPIDDAHNMSIVATFRPADRKKNGKSEDDKSFVGRRFETVGWKPLRIEPYKEYKESDNPTLEYHFPRDISAGDATMMESLGPIVDRENENMGPEIDKAMALLRDMYLKQIEVVRAGGDPKGTIRDKAKNHLLVIPTHEKMVPIAEVRQRQEMTMV